MIKRGPVDVIVVAGGIPRFDGSVFNELERLAKAGTIRVLDAMILVKNEEGNTWRVATERAARRGSPGGRLYRRMRPAVCST